MVDMVGTRGRVNFRDYPGTARKGSEGRHSRRRDHYGVIFYAFASLFTQEADERSDPEDERYFAKCGRDYERYRKIDHKAHNIAVHNIWSDQRDSYHDMDHKADCINLREEYLFLRRLQFTNRFQRRAILQWRFDSLHSYYDNWQHLFVS